MNKMLDIIGLEVGLLTVLSFDKKLSKPKSLRWICVCECGLKVSHLGQSLRQGRVYSCGCKRNPESKQGVKGSGHQPWGAGTEHLDKYLSIPWS